MSPLLRAPTAAEVEDALRWYEAHRDGLGDEFLDVVQSALESIRLHPQAAPIVHRDTHRHLLPRFPYALFYRLIEGQPVVVGCFHATRSPRAWRSRR